VSEVMNAVASTSACVLGSSRIAAG
jgi:hypothetical protein